MLPLFMLICSGLDVFNWYIHRLYKLSMVLRLKWPSLIKLDMVSSLVNERWAHTITNIGCISFVD